MFVHIQKNILLHECGRSSLFSCSIAGSFTEKVISLKYSSTPAKILQGIFHPAFRETVPNQIGSGNQSSFTAFFQNGKETTVHLFKDLLLQIVLFRKIIAGKEGKLRFFYEGNNGCCPAVAFHSVNLHDVRRIVK